MPLPENHIKKLIISAVDAMKTIEWQLPPAWNAKMKIKFLDDINDWLLERELYEQCEILQNLKNEL